MSSLFSSAFSFLLVRVNILEGCCSAVNGSFWMCLNHILVLILPLVCLLIFSIDKRTLHGLDISFVANIFHSTDYMHRMSFDLQIFSDVCLCGLYP